MILAIEQPGAGVSAIMQPIDLAEVQRRVTEANIKPPVSERKSHHARIRSARERELKRIREDILSEEYREPNAAAT